MALTIEQAQTLSEMRVRMLNNERNGKPAHEGFSEEELAAGLSMIRQGKNASAAAQAEKALKKGTGRKKKAAGAPVDTKAFFGELDLDADDEEEDDVKVSN